MPRFFNLFSLFRLFFFTSPGHNLTEDKLLVEAAYMAHPDRAGFERPSDHDILSPCPAAADFMRRTIDRETFADWLAGFAVYLETGRGQSTGTSIHE